MVVLASYKPSHTSVFLLRYPFVWCPKRRRKVLVGALGERLKELLREKAEELGWDIIALEVMPDHVHLFLSVGPDVAPSQGMHRLKGYTSPVLRREFPHLIRLPALWTRSYFVSTAGRVSEGVAKGDTGSQWTGIARSLQAVKPLQRPEGVAKGDTGFAGNLGGAGTQAPSAGRDATTLARLLTGKARP